MAPWLTSCVFVYPRQQTDTGQWNPSRAGAGIWFLLCYHTPSPETRAHVIRVTGHKKGRARIHQPLNKRNKLPFAAVRQHGKLLFISGSLCVDLWDPQLGALCLRHYWKQEASEHNLNAGFDCDYVCETVCRADILII